MRTIAPSWQALALFAVFGIAYCLLILRKAASKSLDLYDLLMLSMVAVVPGVFLFLPGLATRIAEMVGVAFPFVIMFSALFAVLFVFAHRLTVRVCQLEADARLLVQEIGLLREDLKRRNEAQ